MKKQIFTSPTLHNYGGDLSKNWYIEYYYCPIGSNTKERVRIYKGINTGDAQEREEAAYKIIADLNKKMLDGSIVENARTVENVLIPTAQKTFAPKTTVTGANKDTIIALNEYLEQARLRLSFRSYQTYKSILYKFSLFVGQKYNGIYYTYLQRKHLIEYLGELAKGGLSRTTIKKNTQVIHNFFKWLYENEKIAQNIAVNLPTTFGNIVDNAPRPITKDEIAKLKKAIADVDKQLWLACMFEYYAAIRPTELRQIKLRDVDFQNKQVVLHSPNTKNKKNDVVRLHSSLVNFMLTLGYEKIENKDLYLFGFGGFPNFAPVAKNSLYNRFKTYCEALHLPAHVTFYSWKHTGAVDAINNGMPPFELKEHLRHASFTTTEIYLKNKTKVPKNNDDFFTTL